MGLRARRRDARRRKDRRPDGYRRAAAERTPRRDCVERLRQHSNPPNERDQYNTAVVKERQAPRGASRRVISLGRASVRVIDAVDLARTDNDLTLPLVQ